MKIIKYCFLAGFLFCFSCMSMVKDIMKDMNHPTAFSPNEEYLACVKGKSILIYKTADGSLYKVLNHHNDIILHIAFLPKGDLMVSSGMDDNLVFWNTKDWKVVQEYKNIGKGYISFSADGSFIALGKHKAILTGDEDQPTRILSLYPPFNVRKIPSHADYQQAVFAPAGNYFLSMENTGIMKKYTLPDFKLVKKYRFSPARAYNIRFITENEILLWRLTGSAFDFSVTALIFNLHEGKITSTLKPEDLGLPSKELFAFHQNFGDGKLLFSSKSLLLVYDRERKKIIRRINAGEHVIYSSISKTHQYLSLSTFPISMMGTGRGRVFLYRMDNVTLIKELLR